MSRATMRDADGGTKQQGEPVRSSPAFTLIELLAVTVIVGLLFGTFIPYAMALRETSNRTRCADNLRNIRDALQAYAAANTVDNRQLLPRVRQEPALGGAWTAFTGADDPNPFADYSQVQPNDVSASIWLLVREGYAQPEWFICPSRGGEADAIRDASNQRVAVKARGNFRGPANLTYAIASPFSGVDEYRWNRDAFSSRFALAADLGPSLERFGPGEERPKFDAGARALRTLNSPNHGSAGQNVLYADGSISFETSPYCGVGRTTKLDGGRAVEQSDGDNIYTALADHPLRETDPKLPANEPGVCGALIGPAYQWDAMLAPTADFVPPPPLPEVPAVTATATPTATLTPAPATTQATQR